MFLKLNHQKLDIYGVSKQFVFECYRLTMKLPAEERFGMITQIRKAALSMINCFKMLTGIIGPNKKDN